MPTSIASNFYHQCRLALLECQEFDNDSLLRSMFVTQNLLPYRYQVPEAGNKRERVDLCIDFLLSTQIMTKEPVFSDFLRTIQSKYSEHDARHEIIGSIMLRFEESAMEVSDFSSEVLATSTRVQSFTRSMSRVMSEDKMKPIVLANIKSLADGISSAFVHELNEYIFKPVLKEWVNREIVYAREIDGEARARAKKWFTEERSIEIVKKVSRPWFRELWKEVLAIVYPVLEAAQYNDKDARGFELNFSSKQLSDSFSESLWSLDVLETRPYEDIFIGTIAGVGIASGWFGVVGISFLPVAAFGAIPMALGVFALSMLGLYPLQTCWVRRD